MHLNSWQLLHSPNPPSEGKLIRSISFDSVACIVNMRTVRTKGDSRCPSSHFPGLSKWEFVAGPLPQLGITGSPPPPLLVLSFCHRLLCSWRIRFIPAILTAVIFKTANKHEPLQQHFVFQKDLALPCTVTDFIFFTHVKNV